MKASQHTARQIIKILEQADKGTKPSGPFVARMGLPKPRSIAGARPLVDAQGVHAYLRSDNGSEFVAATGQT